MWPLNNLCTQVVYHPVFKLDIGVRLSDILGGVEEEAIGELQDVRLVNGGYLFPSLGAGIVKGKGDNSPRCCLRDKLEADAEVLGYILAGALGDEGEQGFRLCGAPVELQPDIQVFAVFPYHDDVHIFIF